MRAKTTQHEETKMIKAPNINPINITLYPDGRLDTGNASRYLGLSVKTLAMMRTKGNGPKFIKKGRIFYFKNDLDAWLAQDGRYISTAQAMHSDRDSPTNQGSK